jgi:hypothetical protein
MSEESFNVIFNSQGSNVQNNSNKSAVVYNVNWAAILPKKYKKFKSKFTMKGYNINAILTDHGFANINVGRTNVYDGNSMTNNMGMIFPNYFTTSTTYYAATNNDNNDFWIDYPVNNIVTLSFVSVTGALMANMQHYILILNLIGIKDDDIN